MPGKFYTAVFKGVAVTAAQDLFELTAAAGYPVVIHGWSLSQISDVGDAQEEGLTVTVNRGTSATTSGNGTAVTPQPQDDDVQAAQAAVERNGTTIMSGGTIEELEAYGWNIRSPLIMLYPPELRPKIKGSARWTLELETAPADSLTISGTVWFEE